MEAMRSDLIGVIRKSAKSKWKIIMGSAMCCTSADGNVQPGDFHDLKMQQQIERNFQTHPNDSSIALTTHNPLYPPGKILHIVRSHPKKRGRALCGKSEPVYQAIWAKNTDFDEVLISPVMVQDHMPDQVLNALEKVLSHAGPGKPPHRLSEAEQLCLLNTAESPSSSLQDMSPNRYSETCFTKENGMANTGNTEQTQRAGSPSRPEGIDLTPEGWECSAPLASPEQLSDTSSINSDTDSRRYNREYGHPSDTCSKLSPIAQSPARRSPQGYCFYEQYQLAGHVDEFPNHYLPQFKSEQERPLASSTPIRSTITTKATVESQPKKPPRLKAAPRAKTSAAPPVPATRPPPPAETAKVTFRTNSSESLSDAANDTSGDPLITRRADGSVCIRIEDGLPAATAPAASSRRQQQQTPDLSLQLRCRSEDVLTGGGGGGDAKYYSPTYPTYSNQTEYGEHNYHYHRGHGYHHGHSPYASPLDHSESDTFLSKLTAARGGGATCMQRSREAETITELGDDASPYDSGGATVSEDGSSTLLTAETNGDTQRDVATS